MIEVKLDTSGLQLIQTKLEELARVSSDLTPALEDIGEYLVFSTRKRFGKGVAPDGTPWQENSQVTLARKKGNKPLIGNGEDLLREFHPNISSNRLEFGNTMEYSAVQQFGAKKKQFGKAPWGDIPARPFIGISQDDEQKIAKIINNHIKRVLN